MIPISTLGGMPPQRQRSRRLAVLAALTVVTLVILVWTSRDDSDAPQAKAAETSTSERGVTTTTGAPDAATTTTAYQFPINPAWLPKNSSRYSESEESKLQREEIAATATTTTIPVAPKSGVSTTLKGRSTTTQVALTPTTRRSAPTTAAPGGHDAPHHPAHVGATGHRAADHRGRRPGRPDRRRRAVTVELLRRADVLALLGSAERHPRKQLGQNFVVDPGTIRRIVRAAGVEPGDHVLEIGPGLGSLTLGLLEAGAQVTCVEKDEEMAEVLTTTLAERAPGHEVQIVVADALDVDLRALTDGAAPWRLVANLPYNVSTQIVLRALDEVPSVTSMLVMVQREVGERWVAPPGSRTYGIPSVLIALDASARLAGSIPSEVFYPRPRVDSTLVALARHPGGRRADCDVTVLRDLVRRGFGQRRKTLRRSLGLDDAVFADATVDPMDRPERLGLDDWCRLATASTASPR